MLLEQENQLRDILLRKARIVQRRHPLRFVGGIHLKPVVKQDPQTLDIAGRRCFVEQGTGTELSVGDNGLLQKIAQRVDIVAINAVFEELDGLCEVRLTLNRSLDAATSCLSHHASLMVRCLKIHECQEKLGKPFYGSQVIT